MLNKNYKPWKKVYSIYEQKGNGLEEKRDLVFVFSTEDIEEVRQYHREIGINLLTVILYDGDGVGYNIDNYYNYIDEEKDTITPYLNGNLATTRNIERGI